MTEILDLSISIGDGSEEQFYYNLKSMNGELLKL
jgi:hypothetical protein